MSIRLGNDNLKSECELPVANCGLRKGKAGNTLRINLSAKSESAVARRGPQQARPEQKQHSQRQLAEMYAIYLKNYVFGFVCLGTRGSGKMGTLALCSSLRAKPGQMLCTKSELHALAPFNLEQAARPADGGDKYCC